MKYKLMYKNYLVYDSDEWDKVFKAWKQRIDSGESVFHIECCEAV